MNSTINTTQQGNDKEAEDFQFKVIPKRTIVLECRCCGNLGYYEDIRDDYSADEPDFEFGTCGECDRTMRQYNSLNNIIAIANKT